MQSSTQIPAVLDAIAGQCPGLTGGIQTVPQSLSQQTLSLEHLSVCSHSRLQDPVGSGSGQIPSGGNSDTSGVEQKLPDYQVLPST